MLPGRQDGRPRDPERQSVIRLGEPRDIPFVRQLAANSIMAWIPPHRQATEAQVKDRVRTTYADLEEQLALEPDLVILVDEDDKTGELLSYMILDLGAVEPATGERQAMIVDVAVKPGRRGRYTSKRLLQKATELARERRLEYLVGMISVHNERTLKLVQSPRLGFVIERYQVCKRLSEPPTGDPDCRQS